MTYDDVLWVVWACALVAILYWAFVVPMVPRRPRPMKRIRTWNE